MQPLRKNPVRTTVGAFVLVSLLGFSAIQLSDLGTDEATMRVAPQGGTVAVGDTFTKHVIVESNIATNVFEGELQFDSDRLRVKEISYNTSIADIWAESPWYSRGEGTIHFIGGTTAPGGFVGSGTLLSVTYEAVAAGRTELVVSEARILQHDGIGTEVGTVHTPIDRIFAAHEDELSERTLFRQPLRGTTLAITPPARSMDLTNDGRHTLADLSIFMRHLLTQNPRSDFNDDGLVNLTDLSMLMTAINAPRN